MSTKTKKTDYKRTILYELRNICGNPYVHLFGVLMPIFFVILFSKMGGSGATDEVRRVVNTSIFGTTAMLIPLAISMLGCAATSAQEMEKSVPLRFQLFGFDEKKIIVARMIAELVLVTVGLVLYSLIACLTLDIIPPVWWALLIWLVYYYLLSIVCFMIGYGLASLIKKFGATYCLSMILYFVIISLSGMMGIAVKQLPEAVQFFSHCLPTSYLSEGIMDFWEGGSYNFMPMIQSFLFMAGLAGILLYFSVYKSRRVLK